MTSEPEKWSVDTICVSLGNKVIFVGKLGRQTSFGPYSTDNRSMYYVFIKFSNSSCSAFFLLLSKVPMNIAISIY